MNLVFDPMSKIKEFYDLDKAIYHLNEDEVFIYHFQRSATDYLFLKSLFDPAYAKENMSKIKQMASLIDLLYHVNDDYNKDNDIVNIVISKNKDIRIAVGKVVSVYFKPNIKGIDRFFVGFTADFEENFFIDDKSFNRSYESVLNEFLKYIDKNMTFEEFKIRDNNNLNSLRVLYLKNPDLTYIDYKEIDDNLSRHGEKPEVFFKVLPKIFSDNLLKQIKSIEGLLRFESYLQYGQVEYDVLLHYQLSELKFVLPKNLYAIIFAYDQSIGIENKLIFGYQENKLTYINYNYDSYDQVTIVGYEAIYDYIFQNIKNRLISKLDIPVDEFCNESVVLYRMLSI